MAATRSVGMTIFLSFLFILINILNLIKQILNPIYRLMVSGRVPVVVRTPEDRFQNLDRAGYSFSPNYVELNGGCGVKLPRVHYIDEGPRAGPVVLCLHGEPSWSYLYRNMIPTFVENGYRVVVPDFIGFGKSDKYSSPRNYTHEMHTMVLRFLIDHLELQEISLVCQDWGGLTGLSVVKDCPRLFANLVIMNTGLPDPVLNFDNGGLSIFSKALPFLIWRSVVLLLGTWLPVKSVFNFAFKAHNLPTNSLEGYSAPHPSPLYCGGVASWPLLVPLFKDDPVTPHMWEAKNCLKTWKKPVLLLFGDIYCTRDVESYAMSHTR
ncbi:uncharacterized protein LOC111698219 isoform X2 [Eurytemora carolleeae]|uniref:uncharacterized protein LOC111698219 isoform X2 n=1 Tax=Eurytemora carolleeae TaxID=1294199 RepID=UPI000C7668F2|nr:uncharacterized protein LOC111698219 isoform X2 [Eurytemora carolleeae]|eukprot:XP_023324269.1 uncharacterized protein LOC111698219 isoform X2 [Eurytemora affinis]